LTRGIPVRWLRLLDAKRIADMFSAENKPELEMKVLRGDEPEASKFARIKQGFLILSSTSFRTRSLRARG